MDKSTGVIVFGDARELPPASASRSRIGQPTEVSGAVAFLASSPASLIVGRTPMIDGAGHRVERRRRAIDSCKNLGTFDAELSEKDRLFSTMTSAYEPIPLPDFQEIPVERMRAGALAFYDEIRTRHTVREFSSRPVPRDILETCISAAGTAPNGANHQPWHFVVIGDPALKRRIREAAEAEERAFYAGKAGEEWLAALAPLGTDDSKPFLEEAPWLVCIFGERRSRSADGVMRKNYYVPESVNIATGFLIAALHRAGLATLTHTPNPMGFLNEICGRDPHDKPYILMVVGYPKEGATIPAHAREKKPLSEIATFL